MNRTIQYLADLYGLTRPDIRDLLSLSETDPGNWDDFVESELRRLCKHEGIDLSNPSSFLPVQEAASLHVPSGLELGQEVHSGLSVSVTVDELARGLLLVGSHGAGKTNLAYWLIHDLENSE